MTSTRARASFFGLAVAIAFASSAASAQEAATPPDRSTCRGAYEQGQRLRRGKKLREARDKLMLCARDPCPSAFQPECAKWLGELEAELPTVVVALEGRIEGGDAEVLVDGVVFAPRVDGIAREIDPGVHEFVVKNDRTRLVTRAAVVEGTKAQRIVIKGLSDEPGADGAAARRPVPPLAIGLGVLGVGALATSAIFGVRGLGEKSDIDECSPNCALGDVQSARQTFLVADVALGISVLALGAAVVLYVTRPSEKRPAALGDAMNARVNGRPFGLSF